MARDPYFLEKLLKDGGEIVNFKRRPRFTFRQIFCHTLLLEADSAQGTMRLTN
jgi:hypothetical protein